MNSEKLKLFALIIYLVGFSIIFYTGMNSCYQSGSYCYLYSIPGPLMMVLLFAFTYEIFKQIPKFRKRLWTLGIILESIVLFIWMLSYNSLEPVVNTIAQFPVLLITLAYVIIFGYWAFAKKYQIK